MAKTFEEYCERIGLFPSYGTPDFIEEDEEFKYYLFKVPRHYIREHIAEGGTWLEYEEVEEESTLDKSVVLGIRYLPAYVGIEAQGFDVDFYYYRCKMPKVVLNAEISGTNPRVTYEYAFTQCEEWEKSDEQRLDEELGKFEIDLPAAGSEMPGRSDLNAARKVKKETVHLYEVQLRCGNPECQMDQEPHISSDFFDALYEQECTLCGCRMMEIISSRAIIKEEKDG